MKAGDNVEFNQSKYFRFVRELGSGGTGVTNLFKDETTNTFFAIKKYQPSEENIAYREVFYQRFVEEIKILFKLSHPNIVTVYNYYLYPNNMLGYLQMEHIEGVPIDNYVSNNTINLDKLFRSTVDAFYCLENNSILHRDIRPSNIMIDNDGEVKIIDFGFGKDLKNGNAENSILLNWPATEFPNEVLTNSDYTVQTEIYFLGYLFKKLIIENSIDDFKFSNVIEKMCEVVPEKRYKSFEDIFGDIAKGIFFDMSFTANEKKSYMTMADALVLIINNFHGNLALITDVTEIIANLEEVLKGCALEDFIQNNATLINSFLTNGYSYSMHRVVRVETVTNFYKLFLNSNLQKKMIILENLKMRLSRVEVMVNILDSSDDDLPF